MSRFSISNLDLYYDNGAFKALKNINLEIPANEITAFISLRMWKIHIAKTT